MTLEDAWELSLRINERDGRFIAAPFNVDSFALVLLQEKEDGPSRSPIVDVERYLDLMDKGSAAVESDPDLRHALRDWLTNVNPITS